MISFTDFAEPFSLGLVVWLLSWGLNRVYLTFKMFVS
jgi:hypothetical protein